MRDASASRRLLILLTKARLKGANPSLKGVDGPESADRPDDPKDQPHKDEEIQG